MTTLHKMRSMAKKEIGSDNDDDVDVHQEDEEPCGRQSLFQVVMAFKESSGENGSEADIESRFTSLSLALKTDRLTLGGRLEQQRRQRDTAERNFEQEIGALKQAFESMMEQSSLSSALDLLRTTLARVSSTAEQYGAVQQEARMAKAVHLMLNHAQLLKRAHQRDKKELENVKRYLTENCTEFEAPEPLCSSSLSTTNAACDVANSPMTVTRTSTTWTSTTTTTTATTSTTTSSTTTTTTRFRSVSAVSPTFSPISSLLPSKPATTTTTTTSSGTKSALVDKMRRLSSPMPRKTAHFLTVDNVIDDDYNNNNNNKSNDDKVVMRKLGLVIHNKSNGSNSNVGASVRKFSDSMATSSQFSTIEERCEVNNNECFPIAAFNSTEEDVETTTHTTLRQKFRSISEDFTSHLVHRHKLRSLSTVDAVREESSSVSNALMDELDVLARKRACSTVVLTLKQRLVVTWTRSFLPFLREWSEKLEWPWESEETLLTLRYTLTTLLLLAALLSLLITFLGDGL